MRFVDSLDDLANSEENEVSLAKERAIKNMIITAESAIKYAVTETAKKKEKNVYGFICNFTPVSGEASYDSLIKEWEDTEKTKKHWCKSGYNPNIYRIDRLSYVAENKLNDWFECRYPIKSTLEEIPCERRFIYLTDKDIDTLCLETEKMLKNLGFLDFEVKAVPKKFYLFYRSQKYSIFSSKNIARKTDDGIGKVLYISLSW